MDNKLPQTKCLKVTGEGSIYVSPNRANITLGATTEKISLQEAQEENNLIISNVITALHSLGIANENIQTAIYRIEIRYDYKEGIQLFRGYQVNHHLLIKTDKIDQVGQIVDTAVRQGANTVSNIEFSVAHPEAYYNESLKIALHTTYIKALTLTHQMAVQLNPIPYKIEEATEMISPPLPYKTTLMTKAEATPIQPGQIKISASIVSYYFYC